MLQKTIETIIEPDQGSMAAARTRQDRLTKPQGSLGRLEDLAVQLAGIQRTSRPVVESKTLMVFAADHGVVAEGVNVFPQSVTAQMVLNFLSGGAAINVLARQAGAKVLVADLGIATDYPRPEGLLVRSLGPGTRNLRKEPAMTREQALGSLEAGMEMVEEEAAKGLQLLGLGEMGIGNTTAAAAVTAVFTGLDPAKVAGRGTGLDDEGLNRKVAVIRDALRLHRPSPAAPLEVLAAVGGFEIGGMTGAILAAAARGIPVVLDGFIAGAAGLLAAGLAPAARPYLIASHRSAEPGHLEALRVLGLQPLLDLGLRLGEGTGAALAFHLVEAAARTMNEMATFDEAGVAEKEGRG